MAEIGASSYRRFQQVVETELDHILTAQADDLVRFANSIVHNWAVAEDIAAESIARLLLKRKKFPDAELQRAYLYKIARNRAMDYLRRDRHMVPLETVENVVGGGDPESDAMKRERDEAIHRCLLRLPQQYSQILMLAYFSGFQPQHIALVLHKKPKQVYNLLSRAKTSLKILLEKEGITHEDL